MQWGRIVGALALAAGSLIGPSAVAADWQVAAVSGAAYRLEGKAWVRVAANDDIALGQMVKTLGSGKLTLKRAGVTVNIAPNSRIQLSERPQGKFTGVLQTAGSAEVEVDPGKHIRLAVETPFMAAVVKGTLFTVSTYADYSQTAVKRGRVAVIDVRNRLTADITEGQSAISGPSQRLALAGTGALAAPQPFKGRIYSRSVEGALTEMTGEQTGKAESSPGTSENSNAGGKSESSNAGGTSENSNAGGKSESSKSDNGNSSSGNSSSGNSSSGNSHSGNSSSGNSSSGNSHSGNSNSGNSSSGNSSSGNSHSGNSHSGGDHSGHGGDHGGSSDRGNSGHSH